MKISVILLKPVKGLGNAGEVHQVATSYATNVLYKQGLAKEASAGVLKEKQAKQEALQKNALKEAEHFEQAIAEITSTGSLVFEKAATETGKLFESLDAKKIAHHLQITYHFSIETKDVKLEIAKIDHL